MQSSVPPKVCGGEGVGGILPLPHLVIIHQIDDKADDKPESCEIHDGPSAHTDDLSACTYGEHDPLAGGIS